ncbi:MAG TPA: acetylornithine deacetylase, partial [Porphyromonadaceae bacterium]|nr:acetylornithine deacetylase [Porphyromonadaceae bacterium]
MIERDALYYDAIDLLKALIAIPSLSREETNAADYLSAYLEKKHCKVYRKGNNVWCYSDEYNPKKPTVLLNSHIDTVKPA